MTVICVRGEREKWRVGKREGERRRDKQNEDRGSRIKGGEREEGMSVS